MDPHAHGLLFLSHGKTNCRPCHQQSRLTSSIPSINLDISAVMLLVSNMCEPSGARFKFQEEMINKHVENERETPAKKPLLEKLKGIKIYAKYSNSIYFRASFDYE